MTIEGVTSRYPRLVATILSWMEETNVKWAAGVVEELITDQTNLSRWIVEDAIKKRHLHSRTLEATSRRLVREFTGN